MGVGVGMEMWSRSGGMGWDGMDWICGKVVGGEGGGEGEEEEEGERRGARRERNNAKESGREHQPAPVSSISLANFPPQIAHCSFWLIVY